MEWTEEQGAAYRGVFNVLAAATNETFAFGPEGEQERRGKQVAYWAVLKGFEPATVCDAGRKLAGACRRMPSAAEWADMARTLARSKRQPPTEERTYADVCSVCNGLGWELYTPDGHTGQPYARKCSCPASAKVPNPKATSEQHDAFIDRLKQRYDPATIKRRHSKPVVLADVAAGKQPALEPCANCGTPADLDAGLCFGCYAQQQEAR